MSLCSSLSAGIKDRVVAYVDSTAITLSELEKKYAETVHVTPAVTREEVLDTMINRLLFVREARKIRLKSQLEDELLKEYVDLKIRAFIRIKDEEIRTFFDTHASDFLEKELDEMREDIENYLIEQEVNKRLKEHIAELRNNACVKIQLNPQNQE
ncbi:MAG: SurA N-terminal domain-containing protein [Thermodesulfovibrionales bacterium]|nr:SurA N-terminal domain-containing protein [Thermodesulfovibrionales bacterium]